jgi:dihydroflavonol-4-reductase
MKRVLVTGITGYIGQHIAAELLTQRYEVVGTLRSLPKAEKTIASVAHLPGASQVRYIEADLLSDVNWAEALEGCDYLIHVASPFFLKEPIDPNQLITPAGEGTQRVLAAAIEAKLKRVVLTSSIAAMTSGKTTGTYGPDSWSELNKNIGVYAKSKTLA